MAIVEYCVCVFAFQVSEMVKKLYLAPNSALALDVMNKLVEQFCQSPKWSGRQTFVFICQVGF